MKLSIVATLYQSEIYIAEFLQRSKKAAEEVAGEDYEIILVNDGSPDNSLQRAVECSSNNSQLTIVDLSRNFGHHKAMMTGLAHTKGDKVFLIDCDLEEDPELLLSFARKMENEKCDVIYGVQKSRRGGWFERFSGWLFFILFNVLTGFDFPKNVVTARLMKRVYVDALLKHQEREVSIGGLFYLTGFDQRAQVVKKGDSSASTYTLRHKIALLVNSVASFSSKPLVAIFFLGLSVFTLSLVFSLYFVANAMFFGSPPSGWTFLIISIWLLGGLIISCIGVVGIYISKIFIETKQRPYTIVRRIYPEKGDEI